MAMEEKWSGFMKKVNNQFSSSGNFKGQGRVLGSSSSGPVNPINARPSQAQTASRKPVPPPSSSSSSSSSNSNPSLPSKPTTDNTEPTRKPENGFDPYGSLITSSMVSKNGFTLNMLECPICGAPYRTEEEVSEHVEICVNTNSSDRKGGDTDTESNGNEQKESSRVELEVCVGSYLLGNPPEGSVQVVLRLLRNIVKEPGNDKFRKIRMSNPKIKEAVGDVSGGVELLEHVGFMLKEDGGEMFAVMDVPERERITLINRAIMLLEPGKTDDAKTSDSEKEEKVEPKKIDRQIRVFFSVPESVAAKIELPDSFYNLSADELKREAELRRKKIAESQLLIPKSYKEKQAKAARRKYRRTMIRIQFPDGVVLQAVFAPWEPTSNLYKFVSSSLKEPSLEFELLDPVLVKRRVIPCFPAAGQKPRTLDDENLVPSALIKFKPTETDSIVFTGLSNELLEMSEPLGTN
ncbi:hypothetical protein V6N13_105484 [Hibiscus sabdariffa]|uniref:UBX domain-containing protein n=1 Tax=Hibiscus sabdariffa TaxID=183260 RepID=A0ABR2EXU5_9ROSI